MRAKGRISTSDWDSIARVYFTFIILDRGCDTLFAKDPSVFLDNGKQQVLLKFRQVQNI